MICLLALFIFCAGLYVSYDSADLMVWCFLLSLTLLAISYFKTVRFSQYVKKYSLGVFSIIIGATFLEFTLDLFFHIAYWDAFYFALFFLVTPYTLYFIVSIGLKTAAGVPYSDKKCYVCYKRPKTLSALIWALLGGQYGHKAVIIKGVQYGFNDGVFSAKKHIEKRQNVYFRCSNGEEYLKSMLGAKFKPWFNCFVVLRKF